MADTSKWTEEHVRLWEAADNAQHEEQEAIANGTWTQEHTDRMVEATATLYHYGMAHPEER